MPLFSNTTSPTYLAKFSSLACVFKKVDYNTVTPEMYY